MIIQKNLRLTHRTPGQECHWVRKDQKTNCTTSKALSVSHLFTLLNKHLILLSSSLVPSTCLYHMVEVMTINFTQGLKGQPFRGKNYLSLYMSYPNLWAKASLVHFAPEPTAGPVAEARLLLAAVMLVEGASGRKEQFSFQERSFIGGHENCQLPTTSCPALFWCWDMCSWEGCSFHWVIPRDSDCHCWCHSDPSMERFCSIYFSNTATSMRATSTSSQKCLSDSCVFISPHPHRL